MLELLGWLTFWVGGAVVVGVAAHNRGHMGFGWFVLSLVFSPLLMGLLMLALRNKSAAAQAGAAEVPTDLTHMRCPACRELVRRDARKCKHCGEALGSGA